MNKKDILIELQEEIQKSDKFYSNYPKKDEITNFIWVGTTDEIIGDWNCHYEFIYENESQEPKEKQSPYLSIEVHISECNNQSFFNTINLDKELQFQKWYYEKEDKEVEKGRIVFKNWKINYTEYTVSELIEQLLLKLKQIDELVGKQLKLRIVENNLLPKSLEKFEKSGEIIKARHLKSFTTEERVLNIQHSLWEEKLEKQINGKTFDYDKIGHELPFVRIDIYGKKGDEYDIFEVKPYYTATQCIKEALGQILYYKYQFKNYGKKVRRLFIAGPGKLLKSDAEYLDLINEGNSLSKIEYIQIQ